MYPYQYPLQGMYPPYPMAYRGCYLNYPVMCGVDGEAKEDESSDINAESVVLTEQTRKEGPLSSQGGMQTSMQPGMGVTPKFPTGMSMQPNIMPMQPGMMMQDMMAQLGTLQQDSFSLVLKQIQIESPQLINALVSLGLAIDNLRQIILRIMEAANKDQK